MTVIHNWADTAAIVPSPKDNPFARTHGLHDRFVVLHAGNIGLSQNLDMVIDAAAALKSRSDIVFLFIGDGNRRPALEAAARARDLGNVRFLPFQPRDQLRWTYASSDVCLVSLKPGLAGYIVPSKLYPILAAGRPYIAAVEPLSEVAAVTDRHRCGVLVEAGQCRRPGSAIAPARRCASRARIDGRPGARGRGAVWARSASRRPCAGPRRSGGPAVKRVVRHDRRRRRADRVRAGVAADRARDQARRRRAGVLYAGARRP